MEGKKQAKIIWIFGLCEGSVVSEILKGKRKEMYYFTISKDKIILGNLKNMYCVELQKLIIEYNTRNIVKIIDFFAFTIRAISYLQTDIHKDV